MGFSPAFTQSMTPDVLRRLKLQQLGDGTDPVPTEPTVERMPVGQPLEMTDARTADPRRFHQFRAWNPTPPICPSRVSA